DEHAEKPERQGSADDERQHDGSPGDFVGQRVQYLAPFRDGPRPPRDASIEPVRHQSQKDEPEDPAQRAVDEDQVGNRKDQYQTQHAEQIRDRPEPAQELRKLDFLSALLICHGLDVHCPWSSTHHASNGLLRGPLHRQFNGMTGYSPAIGLSAVPEASQRTHYFATL